MQASLAVEVLGDAVGLPRRAVEVLGDAVGLRRRGHARACSTLLASFRTSPSQCEVERCYYCDDDDNDCRTTTMHDSVGCTRGR